MGTQGRCGKELSRNRPNLGHHGGNGWVFGLPGQGGAQATAGAVPGGAGLVMQSLEGEILERMGNERETWEAIALPPLLSGSVRRPRVAR